MLRYELRILALHQVVWNVRVDVCVLLFFTLGLRFRF